MLIKDLLIESEEINPNKYYLAWTRTGMVLSGPYDTLDQALTQKRKEIHKQDLSALKGSHVIKKQKQFE